MKTRILAALGLLAFLVWNPYPLQVLELKVFDGLMSTKPVVQDEMIVLVDIDEEFVKAVGGYPIPRSYYGTLIKRTDAIPGITVLMPDPDLRGSGEDDTSGAGCREKGTDHLGGGEQTSCLQAELPAHGHGEAAGAHRRLRHQLVHRAVDSSQWCKRRVLRSD